MILAIVGSVSFPEWWQKPAAQGIIDWTLDTYYHEIELVVSGGAEGVDTWGEEAAKRMGLPFRSFLPANPRWEPAGFKDRNILIAEACTDLLCIRYKASKTYGSGWTADYAKKLGKKVQRIDW